MEAGRRQRSAAALAAVLGGILVAGMLAVGSASGEVASPVPQVDTGTGWAVTNLAAGSPQGSATPQMYDRVQVDAEGAVVAVHWRPCSGVEACSPRSYLRLSTDAGQSFGAAQSVDDAATAPVVAVAAGHVITAAPGDSGPSKPVVRIKRWGSAPSTAPAVQEIATTERPTDIRVAASGERGLLLYRDGDDVTLTSTEDAGATWSEPVVLGQSSSGQDVDIVGSRAVVAYGAGGGAWSTRVSDDAGVSWAEARTLAAGSEPAAAVRVAVTRGGRVALAASHAEAGSRRGDVRTSVDGVTWTAPTSLAYLSAPQVVELAVQGDAIVASGDGQSVRRSTDGETWAVIREHRRVVDAHSSHPFSSPWRTDVAVSSDGPLTMHGSTLLRSFRDTRPPAVRFTSVPPAATRVANQRVSFVGGDPDASRAWLLYECSFGNNPWYEECASPHSISRWSPEVAGPRQVLRVRVTDAAGRRSPVVTARWTLDERPSLLVWSTSDGPPITRSPRASIRWAAEDAESGAAAYDVRYSLTSQTAKRMSRQWRTTRALTRTRATSAKVAVPHGKVACVDVRAYDRAGNVSAWHRVTCVARPYDDRALKRSGSAKKVRGQRYYGGVATRLTKDGRLVLRGVERGSAVYVLYEHAPRKGTGTLLLPGPDQSFGGRGDKPLHNRVFASETVGRPAGSVAVRADEGSILIDGLAVLPRWAR
ncbi:exo-alpha-sialidase [Mumia zhuanghuii]|uniref:Sialidase family protein n=2 Tax=Mumia TaxID=1546255 RepID=A0ABW1QMM4_9ACTN|nr:MULTISPECIES: sialidase family protein [Mumia]KAA1423385.1 exo-alpha-sialidase [Mumia zhuanghuii]